MSEPIEEGRSKPKSNPLLWIAILVLGLIAYILLGTERANTVVIAPSETRLQNSGSIDRGLLVPPGMRARQFIEQLRAQGQPYPLDEIYDRADDYQREGSLADAHLLYFFGARSGDVNAMIKLAELSDPNLFQADNSLLDHADPLQSYKWYRKAAEQGQPNVSDRIAGLQQWAAQESASGNAYARQFLLVVN